MNWVTTTFSNEIFKAGFFGAIGAEFFAWFIPLVIWMHQPPKSNPGLVPGFHVPLYMWLVYIPLALIQAWFGAALAVYYEPKSLIGAVHVGASVPLFFQTVVNRLPKAKT